jgi:hypothetical protein
VLQERHGAARQAHEHRREPGQAEAVQEREVQQHREGRVRARVGREPGLELAEARGPRAPVVDAQASV